MKKLLIICGSTATGKTSLGIYLANKLNGEIISADSRQVYRGMDIGTGKKLPSNVKAQMSNVKTDGKEISFYEIEGVKIWAYDLVGPKEEFSVGQYEKVANDIIQDIWKRERLPVLVGGTGLYIKAVVNGIPTAQIPQNKALRKSLGENTHDLYGVLAQLDPTRAASLNLSDRKNPRRLVRAIEIADYKIRNRAIDGNRDIRVEKDTLFIGLTMPVEMLSDKIEERVDERVEQGIEKEIKKLVSSGVTWDMQSMQALGYKQWAGYFGKGAKDKVNLRRGIIENWKRAEKQYAKRQITWFKKDQRINWFDISKTNWRKSVEKLAKKWHNK